MEKLIYLLWRPPRMSPDRHRDVLLERCVPRFRAWGARGIGLNVKDSEARVSSPAKGMTGRVPFSAELSLWLDTHEQREPYERELREVCRDIAGYLVTESLYTDYGQNRHARPRDWPDGERSPGVMTVTVLEKPARFDYETWLRHWYGTQSPVSEAMQPRTRYVRNAVASVLTDGAPMYGGIVEEAWPSARHITDPYLFYCASNFNQLVANMRAMLKSVGGFLDLPRIQNVTMSEYLLMTPRFEGG